MSEFTKGPWKVGRRINVFTAGNIGWAICECSGNADATANAHLIASAPDMYEALKEVLRISRESNSVELIEYTPEIAHILAKAKGE